MITEKQTEILNFILKNTSLRAFNYAINNYRLRGLSDRLEKKLIPIYFNGNDRAFYISMSEIWSEFQNTNDEQLAANLRNQMLDLKRQIKIAKKYNRSVKYLCTEYNILVDLSNELNKGIVNLSKMYKFATSSPK